MNFGKYLFKIVFFLRVQRGLIQGYLIKSLKLIISNLIIRIPYLEYSQKVKYSCLENLKRLNDTEIKKYGLANDKGYLALKLFRILP